jgi:hypothetical protein
MKVLDEIKEIVDNMKEDFHLQPTKLTYLQALSKLVAHLEEQVNRTVTEITLGFDTPINGEWKFFVEFDDELEVMYIKEESQ